MEIDEAGEEMDQLPPSSPDSPSMSPPPPPPMEEDQVVENVEPVQEDMLNDYTPESHISDKRGKKKKTKESGEKKRKAKKKKKVIKHVDSGGEDSDTRMGSDNESDFAEPSPKEKRKRSRASNNKDQKSSDELCSKYGLNNVDVEFCAEDYQTLSNYKAFSQFIKPLIAKENPKIAMSKMVSLVGAKWREFVAKNPHKSQAKQKIAAAIVDDELIPEPEDIEGVDEKSPSRPKKAKTKKSVAPLKIKITKKKKKRKASTDEEDTGFNTSDEEFERQLEEASVITDTKSDSSSSKKRTKRTKAKKKKTKTTSKYPDDPDAEGYETDHQDYCEVCQQGGEIILCDTCPRAYHLVCLDPELEEAPEGKWSCPHCVCSHF